MAENIVVAVRIRGFIAREKDQAKAFVAEDSTDVVQKSNGKKWTFDRVYGPKENTRYYSIISCNFALFSNDCPGLCTPTPWPRWWRRPSLALTRPSSPTARPARGRPSPCTVMEARRTESYRWPSTICSSPSSKLRREDF